MKIKNILLSTIIVLSLFTLSTISADAVARESNTTINKCTQVTTNGLKTNQTELYYMYSNDTGHYFLDPKAEFENVIYVGLNDYLVDSNFKIDTPSLHHGKKFIGTFTDDTLWELVKIEEVNNLTILSKTPTLLKMKVRSYEID
ncbi:hypothetical protein ACQKNX_08075 [Lysinibacillus sp. NPDC093712]|uniref:hypothetical protein n=1 Tax=Lysinibacillus sp. NPDC093712 TaxID=3390579 RepID=UPI003D014C79